MYTPDNARIQNLEVQGLVEKSIPMDLLEHLQSLGYVLQYRKSGAEGAKRYNFDINPESKKIVVTLSNKIVSTEGLGNLSALAQAVSSSLNNIGFKESQTYLADLFKHNPNLSDELDKLSKQNVLGNKSLESKYNTHESSFFSNEVVGSNLDSSLILEYGQFKERYKDQLRRLAQNLSFTATTSVLLESGHIYTNKQFDSEVAVGLNTGSNLYKFMTDELGLDVQNLLFVDEYNATGKDVFNMKEYVRASEQFGFKPDFLYFEGDMVDLGEQIITSLSGKDYITEEFNELYFTKGNTHKRVKDSDGRLTCAVLDASLSLLKEKITRSEGGGAVVNVLPQGWHNQQADMKQLVKYINPYIAYNIHTFYTQPDDSK